MIAIVINHSLTLKLHPFLLTEMLVRGNGRLRNGSILMVKSSVSFRSSNGNIKSDFIIGARGNIIISEIDFWAEREVEWSTIVNVGDDLFGLNTRVCWCCGETDGREKVAKDWGTTITYFVVALLLGDFATVEDVVTFGVDGQPTDALGEIGGREDVEEQFAFEHDGVDIVGDTVGTDRAAKGH